MIYEKSHNYSLGFCFIVLIILFNSCNNKITKDDFDRKKEISSQLYQIRKYEDSLILFLENSIRKEDDIGKLYSYRLLGNYMRENARFTEAINYHQLELETSFQLQDTTDIIQALNNIGTDFRRLGAMSEASDYHYRALDYAEAYSEKDSPEGMKNRVVSLNGIGNISLTLGYLDDAKKHFIEALKDEKKLNSPIGQAINYANIGAIYEQSGMNDSARVYYNYSLEQNMIAKSDMGIGLCYIHLGDIDKSEKKYEQAKIEYEKAYNLMEDISDRWHWLVACISIAEIHYLTGNLQEFNRYINKAETVAEAINSPEHLSEIFALKHEHDLQQKNYKSAMANFKKSIAMQDSVQGITKKNQYLDLRVTYEKNKYNRNIDRIEAENRVRHERRQVMLYIMLLASIAGVIISALLYYAYRQRTRSNEILKQIETARSEFFKGITHEFRTPLTVIMGLAEQVSKNSENKTQAEGIMKQGYILLDMVNQLLDMAKIKSRIEKEKWVHGDIVAFTDMSIEAFRSYATSKGIDLIFTSEERKILVDFIPSYLEKIMANLLSNGLKHTPRGGKITVSLVREKSNLKLECVDTGSGITLIDLPHIFQEFYVGEGGAKKHGSGIGLALVQKMVEAMNGDVMASNHVEGGSIFTVIIPLKQKFEVVEIWDTIDTSDIYQTPSVVVEDDFSPNDYNTGIEQGGQREGQLVLIVEDNADIQSYIGSLLENRYEIVFASNGDEGFKKAVDFMPDLIITDLMMPVMDGFELANKIRKNNVLNHIPIIVITAKTSEEDKQHALEIGADAYLYKPFNATELRIRVEKLLEQRLILRNKYSEALIEGTSEDVDLSDADREFLNRVISIVYKRIAEPDLNADYVSEQVYMSRSQLNRKIKQITGYSISAFILHIRLEKAKRMLHTDNTRIGDIAMSCGFDDSNYFSRVFKQIYKVSPSQYRKTPK